ncbi:MAG: c-type cytochrome domain-containing protein [Balneola sp.]
MKKTLLLSFILVLGINCVNNVEDQVPEIPDEPISYASDIQPIFNNTCGGGFCHTNGDNTNGVNLDSYQNSITSMGSSYGGLIIVPSNADNSPLVDKLGSNPEFGSRMPSTGSISSSDVGKIIAWINQGAQNN